MKKKEEVIGLINKANKQCEVVYVNGLDTDLQVEGSLVTVRNRKKEERGE